MRGIEEINFGMYAEDGSTSGEMAMEWIPLDSFVAPRLKVFNDAWDTLWQFRDLLEAMAECDGQDITPQEFVELLDKHGFKDLTHRERT